ncbi:hypothetical protein BGX27_006029, partial [Mortierella sp. AM989]
MQYTAIVTITEEPRFDEDSKTIFIQVSLATDEDTIKTKMVIPAKTKKAVESHVLYPLSQDLISGRALLGESFDISGVYKHQSYVIDKKLVESKKLQNDQGQ